MEIRQTQANVRGKYRSYSASDLHEAYAVVVEQGLPVERVAKRFNIPITTLKDRVKGRVHIDTVRSGPQTMFTLEQEAFLCKHLMTMAEIGFGYSRQETINLATDYAVHLGIREKSKPFSLTWLYSFLDRWPELKVKKPRSLEIARAKYATRPTIDSWLERSLPPPHEGVRWSCSHTVRGGPHREQGIQLYSDTFNIQSAFRRCGIYPFNPDVINDKSIAPSLTFHPRPESSTCPDELQGDKSDPKNETTMSEARIFLEKRGGQILENVTVAKVRRTLSKVVGGKPIMKTQCLKT
ncbi:uncharacterized protein LOC128550216 [Mercenaria mercenaria]|uniref:uncharacterized protein LOC128550216 n=1 Tax=Mercenaria mercenaria TaxID=6596 RepID=UPI00234F7842|nr:uncharacterized protein LOC128550216 [Mercenaria mercenaria]